MSPGTANSLWAGALADELARAGVTDVVLAPGSRSTPLVMAFATDERFRLRVHLDERSAAYFALGIGKAAARPAVVLTTSGTAAANVFPAVVEASLSETPLLVLTADRPHRFRDADANQAIDQVRLFGSYPKASFELAPPSVGGPELRHLRSLTGRAVGAALGPPAGPVHLNCPFDKPLEPVAGSGEDFAREQPLAAGGRPDGGAFVRVRASLGASPAAAELTEIAALVRDTERGVVIAGPAASPEGFGGNAARLAAAASYPLLADPLSGARFGAAQGALVVGAYDLFLRDPEIRERLAPTLIVRVGRSPTSAALQGYLLHHSGVRHLLIDGGGRWKDHEALVTDYFVAHPGDALGALADRVEPRDETGWRDAWALAEGTARAAAAAPGSEAHEGELLAAVAATVPPRSTLFVSSSMPVRDLDAFGAPREDPVVVLGNRGASGIDGVVSTAFGAASVSRGPTVCVLGDVALFHDQNGLLWSREPDVDVVFVLVDNDGGGIFHMLPIRDHDPHFTRYFATPHGLDFRHSAALCGVALQDVDQAGLAGALERSLAEGGSRILRVKTDRLINRRRHEEVAAAVRDRVLDALGPPDHET